MGQTVKTREVEPELQTLAQGVGPTAVLVEGLSVEEHIWNIFRCPFVLFSFSPVVIYAQRLVLLLLLPLAFMPGGLTLPALCVVQLPRRAPN